MVHSTFTAGGFFLLADIIVKQRGSVENIMIQTAPFQKAILTGSIFFVFAIASAGLPPLSGFFGKVMILSSAIENTQMWIIFTLFTVSSLLIIVALARTGSNIFYDTKQDADVMSFSLKNSTLYSVVFLFLFIPLMVVFANPVTKFTGLVGVELTSTKNYIESTLNINLQGDR
jgi:multicomponent K+:H+ antiporter subunit D